MYLDCSGWFGTRIPRSTMVRYGPRVCDSRIGAAQQWSPSRRLPWPPSTPWCSREPRHRMEQPLPTQSYSHTLKWQQHIYIYIYTRIYYIYICVYVIYIYAILHYYCYIIILLIYPSSDTSTQAEQLLGGETCETDFLESSEWPLKTFDLHLSECLSDRKVDILMVNIQKAIENGHWNNGFPIENGDFP